MEQML
jgi:hypothetical protein